MSIAYLDNAATTPVDQRVAKRMMEVLSSPRQYGNAASSHAYGEGALALVEAAREEVAQAVGAADARVIFTSGATEANNLAIFGCAEYYRAEGRHLITARTEHKAVLDPHRELERRGWRVTYLEPDPRGVIAADRIGAALTEDTTLVSLMLVNNEIGVISDVRAVAQILAAHPKAHLHVDAAQAVGKMPVDFRRLGADLMALSAHKAYGPKGIGALIVGGRGRGVHLLPQQLGGGQEAGLRSGTLPTHQIVGMGAAFSLASASVAEDARRAAHLRERLWQGLAALGGVIENAAGAPTVPHILNVSFEGVEGESLLASIEGELAVSTGSACTSASREPSYVLRALLRDDTLSEASLRFGLGRFNKEGDIEAAIAALTRVVPRLRRIAGA
jgi:cysteine desulfurase